MKNKKEEFDTCVLQYGIVENAMFGWWSSHNYLELHPTDTNRDVKTKRMASEREIADAEKFFRSEWFRDLVNDKINADWLLEHLKECIRSRSKYFALKKRVELIIVC